VVGGYGEASADVHALLKLAAAAANLKKAEIKEVGSLSLRRHWGLTFVREYARMRFPV
jgi:hypothetical protein